MIDNQSGAPCASAYPVAPAAPTTLAPDPAAMSVFLRTLFDRPDLLSDGLIELNWDHPKTGNLNRWERFPVHAIYAAVAKAEAVSRAGSRIYFGAGLRRQDIAQEEGSTNADIIAWPALVWDFDSLEASENGLQRAAAIGLNFHMIVRTGAIRDGGEPDLRVQCWALLRDPITDMSEVSRLLKLGISYLGADKSIHDPRRVMRLAGSIAWARKEGRVDEPTRLIELDGRGVAVGRHPPYAIAQIETLLAIGAPAVRSKAAPINVERLAEVRARLEATGAGLDIWRKSPAVETFLADLLDGREMNPSIFRLAMAAAREGHDRETVTAALLGLLDASEARLTRPGRCAELEAQLPEIVGRAFADAGAPSTATPYVPAPEDFAGAPTDDTPLDPRERLFADFAWCEALSRAIEINTGVALDRTQLDIRMWEVGPIGHKTQSAWAVLGQRGDRRLNVKGLNFAPAGGRLIQPQNPANTDPYINIWRPDPRPIRPGATDADVKPFLDHAAFVIPDPRERGIVLDWMAWVAQHQDLKPNWALVVGSAKEGIGKDLLFNPLRRVIRRDYVTEINAEMLISNFNGWLGHTKLLIVQEMENFERRRTNDLLKPLLASPPEWLMVNEKYQRPYPTPNIVACVFFTNERNAVQITRGDRRYFVVWNDEDARDPLYYKNLVKWYCGGGEDLSASWLLSRDVRHFDAKGRAPATIAKEEMRKASRPPVVEWIEDSLAAEDAPFNTDLICVEDVRWRIPAEVCGRLRPNSVKMGALLRDAGLRPVGKAQIRMGARTGATRSDRMRLMSCRRHEMYARHAETGSADRLRDLFWAQYERAGGQRISLAA